MVKSATAPKKPRVLKDKTAKPALSIVPTASNGPPEADREAFHYHLGSIRRVKDRLDAVKKLMKTARRAAQDAGLHLGDLDRVIRMRDEEPETVQASIQRLATYAQWAGMAPGIQGDLFANAAASDDHLARAEDEGWQDGIEGVTAAGDRYDITTETGQARLKGWQRGQEVLASRFKPLEPTLDQLQ